MEKDNFSCHFNHSAGRIEKVKARIEKIGPNLKQTHVVFIVTCPIKQQSHWFLDVPYSVGIAYSKIKSLREAKTFKRIK